MHHHAIPSDTKTNLMLLWASWNEPKLVEDARPQLDASHTTISTSYEPQRIVCVSKHEGQLILESAQLLPLPPPFSKGRKLALFLCKERLVNNCKVLKKHMDKHIDSPLSNVRAWSNSESHAVIHNPLSASEQMAGLAVAFRSQHELIEHHLEVCREVVGAVATQTGTLVYDAICCPSMLHCGLVLMRPLCTCSSSLRSALRCDVTAVSIEIE